MKDQLPYVVGVYMGIWVVLLGYVFIVNNKLSGLKKELGALSKAVEKKNK
ncbi:CcmD family protein [Candidatus Aquicultor secundus]|nr:CcmD family protein [Candidatus Aquicultor secundus]NCO65178.1 CcmD family protein [Solirubrobacter sp.]